MIWTNYIRNPSFHFAYLLFVYFNLWEELLHAAVNAAVSMLRVTFFSLWPETKVCSLAYRSENFWRYYAIQAGWHAPLCGQRLDVLARKRCLNRKVLHTTFITFLKSSLPLFQGPTTKVTLMIDVTALAGIHLAFHHNTHCCITCMFLIIYYK